IPDTSPGFAMPAPAPIYRFGLFELRTRTRELYKAGTKLKLRPQPFQILNVLVERAGDVVSREELRQLLWSAETFVDFEHGLNTSIKELRGILCDSACEPRYIGTLPRLGYRIMVPVEVVEPELEKVAASAPCESPGSGNLSGKKVSHYRVLQLLGGGGMGVVYKAEDLKLGRQVAVKFLPGELATDALAFGRLQREARAASSLDHPNICSIYELGEHEGQPFIVMQLLQGQTLRDWIESAAKETTRTRLNQLLDFAIQVVDGLEAAHQKGIIHRDIKPANIFITGRGEAKILDFGVVKCLDSVHAFHHGAPADDGAGGSAQQKRIIAFPDPSLTRTGLSMGTPSYLSPEQVRREKLDARSDLFSFGLVLYEMATGERAFSGKNQAEGEQVA